MLIVRLKGGLGNQLFQYALAKSLALMGKEVFLDASFYQYSTETKFHYLLDCFRVDPRLKILQSSQIPWIFRNPPGDFPKKAALALRIMGFTGTWSYYLERQSRFYPEVLNLKEPAYLDGYWQTEKYWHPYKESIVSDFTPKEISAGYGNWLENIGNATAVSVHVRRGDYISNPYSRLVHTICSMEYYRAAFALMTEKLGDPVFFAFSDEPDWVKANFGFLGESLKVISGLKLKDYEEMILMSRCQHHIIANSTFSWWGARLNGRSGKIVIAPKQWFYRKRHYDLIPDDWVQL